MRGGCQKRWTHDVTDWMGDTVTESGENGTGQELVSVGTEEAT